MTYRPYPNRDRALAQVHRHPWERGPQIAAQPIQPLTAMVAYFNSAEHRRNMQRVGQLVGEFMRQLGRVRVPSGGSMPDGPRKGQLVHLSDGGWLEP